METSLISYHKVGFFAWSLDALDFHAVTLTYLELATTFGRSTTDISIAVTLSLALRSLGAGIFGIVADLLGRKWPLVCNLILLIILELSTGFCGTYNQFLAVRALFGIAMGGIYGNAAATALEDCPELTRGLMSGIYQSGCPFGYLLAIVFWKALDDGTSQEWRSLFWYSAGLPVLLIIWRICLPETEAYKHRNYHRREKSTARDVFDEAKVAVKRYWLLMLYLVLLVTGFSYMVDIISSKTIN
jgi:MFS transporter, SHS family, lactate transporter